MTSRRRVAPAAVLAAALTLSGCAPTGEGIAKAAGEDTAAAVAESLDRIGVPTATADYLAASDVFGARSHSSTQPVVLTEVRPIEWSGETTDDGGARVVIRVATTVEAYSPSTFGSRGNSAGADVSCFEIRVTAVRSDESTPRRIACAANEQAIPSDPTGPLRLPDDAVEIVLDALAQGTDEQTIRDSLTDALPEGVGIQVEAYRGGYVAAVGAAPTRECVVAIRAADGTVERAGGWAPESEQPGELGCSTDLVTRPPL